MAVSLKKLVDSNKHHFVKIIGEIYEYHLVSPWSFLHGQDCRLNICRNLHCINKVAWTRSFLFFNNDSLFAGSDVRLTFFFAMITPNIRPSIVAANLYFKQKYYFLQQNFISYIILFANQKMANFNWTSVISQAITIICFSNVNIFLQKANKWFTNQYP